MGINEILDSCWGHINEGAFGKSWSENWSEDLRDLADGSDEEIEYLGDNLREIFMRGKTGNRDQSSVSIAGRNWKKMLWAICASLSTCGCTLPLFGRKMIQSTLNKQLLDTLKITIGKNDSLSITPDLIILRFRTSNIEADNLEDLKEIIDNDFSFIESINILWSKTNFNDNIKEYMLWSWIGEIQSKNKTPIIKFSWVTVPTNDPNKYGIGNAPLIRANSFNNGGFWGIGDVPELSMKSIIELIPDWKKNMNIYRNQGSGSKFMNSAFPKNN